VVLRRWGRLEDGWVPAGVPNEKSRQAIATTRAAREEAGLSWAGFDIQAQAQARGGSPERWKTHHDNWRELGCTHLAIVIHYVGNGTDVDAHLTFAERSFEAVRG